MRQHLWPVLGWTLIWALFFGTVLAGKEHLPGGDFTGQFHAFALFQGEEMARGRIPVWSPGEYAGFPFAADTQAAAFYAPRWLAVLLTLPQGFSFYALEIEALAHVWLAGLFTYFLCHALTGRRRPALLSAVAFGLGGYLTAYPLLQLAILESIAWLPLILLLLHLGVTRPRPVPRLVAAGLALAASFTAGHPQTFLHVSYLSAAYFLYRAIRANWRAPQILGLGGLVAATALGASAAAWLPALQLALHTTRSETSYAFVSGGLPMLDYLQTLVPGVLSSWVPEYVGLAALTMAFIAWWGRKEPAAAPLEVGFWSGAALTAGWLALGDAGVLFQLAHRLAPGFSLFRQQERLLGLVSLSLALLAGQGLAIWLQVGRESRKRLLSRTSLTVAVGLGVAAAILFAGPQLTTQPWPMVCLRQIALFAAIVALLALRRLARFAAVALVLLLSLDFYAGTRPAMNLEAESPALFWPQPAWLADLKAGLADHGPARVDSRNLFHANLGTIYGLEDVRGISPLKLSLLSDLEALPLERRWQLLGVRYVLSDTPLDMALEPAGHIDESVIPGRPADATVYRFNDALPRAWMSYRPIVVADSEAARQLLGDPTFDPASQVILEAPVTGIEEVAPPDSPAVVAIQRLNPATLRVEVTTEAPGLLVISEWNYPGWQAELDGRRVSTTPADYALQALLVPAGRHTVALRFRPTIVVAGILSSLLTLALGLGIAWRWRRAVIQTNPVAALDERGVLARPVGWRPSGLGPIRRWAMIALIFLAFGLRVYNLGLQELRGDEAFSYQLTEVSFGRLLPELASRADPHPPGHYLLLKAWSGLVGDSEFALRYATVLGSILLLPLVYLVGRRLLGPALGIVAAGLLAVSQSLVWLGQDVRSQYVLGLWFATLATLLLARAAEKPSRWRWGLYGLACTLILYSHYYAVFVILGHGLYLLVVPARRRHLAAWAAAGLAALLLFTPWLLITGGNWLTQLSEPSSPDLAGYLVAIGQELTVGPAFGHPAGRWLFLVALALAVHGWRTLARQRPAWAALLGGWLAATVLGMLLVLLRRATFNNFYISTAAPAWWLLVAAGLIALWRSRAGWRPAAAAGLLLLLSGAAISLGHYYGDPFTYGRANGLRLLTHYLDEKRLPGDILIANFPDPAIDYYLRRVPLPQDLQPAAAGVEAGPTEAALERLAAEYDRLWFIPAHGSVWDPEDVVFRWLDYHTLVEEERTFGKLTLLAYRPLSATAAVMAPLDAQLRNLLALKGAYLTVDGRPIQGPPPIPLPAGARLNVTLAWEALNPIPENYTVFVHLLDETGWLLAQHDGTPAFGTRPTYTWKIGERLLDRHELVIPDGLPDGQANLVVGMYSKKTAERQRFSNGEETVWLLKALVGPAVAEAPPVEAHGESANGS